MAQSLPSQPMKSLFALQEIDVELEGIVQDESAAPVVLRHKEALQAQKGRAEIRERLEEKARTLRRDIRRLEMELNSVEQDVASVETRLFGGNVTNAKELASLQERLKTQTAAKERLEEAILELLDAEEKAARQRDEADALLAAADEEVGKAAAALNDAVSEWETRRRTLLENRNALIASLQPEYVNRYETVRKRKPRPVARVENRACTGCHVGFPTGMKAPAPHEITQCPHCDRLLWWPSPTSEG